MADDPALLMEKAPAPGHPGTHVLIIGIGTYDFLLGGDLEDPDVARGMCQLPAATRSARKVATWFLDEFDNPARELASLAMVLSEPTPASYAHPKLATPVQNLPSGDVEDVGYALSEWMARACTDRRNLAVLYFVGHGLHAGNSILLCRDYGMMKGRRFEGAINLDNLRAALASMQADDQLLLIDACRNADLIDETVRLNGSVGRNVLDPEPLADRGGTPAGQSVHFATSLYTGAWADDDGVTLYTESLLSALSGGGAQAHHGWQVATGGLQEALETYVERAAAEAEVEQTPARVAFSRFVVCRPRQLKVPVYVTCDPDAAWNRPMTLQVTGPRAEVSLRHDGRSLQREWKLDLDVESYDFSVTFPQPDEGTRFEGATRRVMVVPPLIPVTMVVEAIDDHVGGRRLRP